MDFRQTHPRGNLQWLDAHRQGEPSSPDPTDPELVPTSQDANPAGSADARGIEAAADLRVLVIEDDDDLRDSVCRYLAGVGIKVYSLPSAEGLDEQLERHPVDIAICDVNLPTESGFSILARLRLATRIGVIMTTARALEEDRLLGLSLGADCYLTKPVNLRELEFVVRNLHRRLAAAPPGVEAAPKERWTLDHRRWSLTAPNGKSLQLTMAEARLVGSLVAQSGVVISREDILAAMGRPNLEAYSRNLDVTVSRLRRRVEKGCDMKLPLSSARGTGYVFSGAGEVVG